QHTIAGHLQALGQSNTEVALVSPLRADLTVDATWYPIRPATDAALMLALAHTILTEDLHDKDFLDKYCVGFGNFARYLEGKDADWASAITEIPAQDIRDLARK